MAALLSLFIIIVASILVVRIATIALMQTGLTQDVAKFQARSAFSGCGFTTREAEQVAGHPVRRKIVSTLMLLGNAGVVTAISSLVLSFVSSDPRQTVERLLLMFAGLLAVYLFARSRFINHEISKLIKWMLNKYSSIDVHDYADLLRIKHNYAVAEMKIREGDWLADKSLKTTDLGKEGVLVIGIDRPGGGFIGAPRGDEVLQQGDEILVYGGRRQLKELNARLAGKEGDRQHQQAIERNAD